MWLLSSRLRRWVIFALAAPALTLVLRWVRAQLETRGGTSSTTKTLRRTEQLVNRFCGRARRK